MIKIDGNTKLTGLIGWPLSHTLSPLMQNAAFAARKINAVYLPFAVPEKALADFLSVIRQSNFLGLNVTIPYKTLVQKYLDEISPQAREIGSVNTIVVSRKKLIGYNTDAFGFHQALKSARINVRGKKILVIGCGGVANAIVWVLANQKARQVLLTDKIQKRALDLRKKYPEISSVINSGPSPETLADIDGVINASPVGMQKNDPMPVNLDSVARNIFVYDVIYNHETALIRYGRQRGWLSVGGLTMLLYQGTRAFQLWTGKNAPEKVMKKILEKELRVRR